MVGDMAVPLPLRRVFAWPRRVPSRPPTRPGPGRTPPQRPPTPGTGKASRRRRAWAALAVTPIAFVLVLTVAWSVAEVAVPEITDTDYHRRLAVIRARAAEHPNNPLGVVIGSSRVVWGFRPEQLPEPAPGQVYWVNAAHVGGGPVINRLLLHRLLRDGVRPEVAVIEVMPVFFVRENSRFVLGHVAASELSLVRGYGKHPLHYDYYFLRHRLWRLHDLGRVFDPFDGHPEPLPRGGHPAVEDTVTPAERARRTAAVRAEYSDELARMVVRPGADRALRDTLAEAADRGVQAVLMRSPEGQAFRSWYDPAGLARFDDYLNGVARTFGVPVIDARDWLAETDFFDSHHPLRRGGDKFTARLARELRILLGH